MLGAHRCSTAFVHVAHAQASCLNLYLALQRILAPFELWEVYQTPSWTWFPETLDLRQNNNRFVEGSFMVLSRSVAGNHFRYADVNRLMARCNICPGSITRSEYSNSECPFQVIIKCSLFIVVFLSRFMPKNQIITRAFSPYEWMVKRVQSMRCDGCLCSPLPMTTNRCDAKSE